MKKIFFYSVVAFVLLTSCKKETKKQEENTPQKETTTKTYTIDANATEVHWTAYKTTAKTPVKGVFTRLNIENPVVSDTKQGAFTNLSFTIPITSFFSKDETRDTKIKTLFFGMMKETAFIRGKFSNITGNENEGGMDLNLKMNGEVVAIPLKYNVEGNIVNLKGNITNLMDWKMEEAFNSLHKACEVLHTGEDGISKTWEDVAINAKVILK